MTLKIKQKGHLCHDDCVNVSYAPVQCVIHTDSRIKVWNKFGFQLEKMHPGHLTGPEDTLPIYFISMYGVIIPSDIAK